MFEVALAALLAGYGVSPAEALAVALLGRMLAILALVPGVGLLAFSGVPGGPLPETPVARRSSGARALG